MASLDSVRPRSSLHRVCRNLSCKLLSHALAALPRRSKTKTGPDRAMRRTAASSCSLATVCRYAIYPANCSHIRSRPCHGVVKRRRARTCAVRRTAAKPVCWQQFAVMLPALTCARGPDRAVRRTAAKTCLLATVCRYANYSHICSRHQPRTTPWQHQLPANNTAANCRAAEPPGSSVLLRTYPYPSGQYTILVYCC